METAYDNHEGSSRTRSAICEDLRKTAFAILPLSSLVMLSTLTKTFTPVFRLLDRVPFVLRMLLSLLSQSHPISWPSICFKCLWLFSRLCFDVRTLFRSHAANDDRVAELEREISRWLNSANFYIDVNNLRGHSAIPMRNLPLKISPPTSAPPILS